MRYIDLTYNSDERTLTVSDSLAGTTVDDLSTSFRLDKATLSRDANIDIVYGVLLRCRHTSVGYSFSRFDGRSSVPIPQDVLKVCRGGSLPIYLRITDKQDGSIETSLPITLRVANLPDPVESVHASGDLVMLRMSSWEWLKGLTYAKDAVVIYDNTLYISKKNLNRGVTPGTDEEWWGTVSASGGLPPGIAPFFEGLRENVQDAIDTARADIGDAEGRIEDLESDTEDISSDVEDLEGEVEAVRTVLGKKQNLITVGAPESPVAGDIWVEDEGPIEPFELNWATVQDVKVIEDRTGLAIAEEARQRTDADARNMAVTREEIADALEEAKIYAERVGSAAYRYKGSVTNSDLTMVRDPVVGDLYNITDSGRFPAGSNVVWDGADWDKLSETVDLSRYDAHIMDMGNPHMVHYSQVGFSPAQMGAINSGVSAQKVGEMDEAVRKIEDMIAYGPSAPSSAKLWIYYE